MEDLLTKFRKFASRSKSAYSELYDRIKEDRSFLSGEKQWSAIDDKFVKPTRNRIVVNVLSNQCHSVANQYSTFQKEILSPIFTRTLLQSKRLVLLMTIFFVLLMIPMFVIL